MLTGSLLRSGRRAQIAAVKTAAIPYISQVASEIVKDKRFHLPHRLTGWKSNGAICL